MRPTAHIEGSASPPAWSCLDQRLVKQDQCLVFEQEQELQGFELSPAYTPDLFFGFSMFPISGFLDMRKLLPGTVQDYNFDIWKGQAGEVSSSMSWFKQKGHNVLVPNNIFEKQACNGYSFTMN